ncbi:MAG: MFS transporter [Defluviitaleaceae bacterium]|nr:MFS transporter [Defluviitaleaceae bacterium]MCL2238587.1 MFS transporter [Defluviitaleaceae bacterium]
MGALLKTSGQFRIFLVYQIFSTLGNGIFSIFMLLSVHLLYRNALYTGIAGFLMSAPRIFSFMVGPVVDRSKKVTIMRLTTLLEFGVLALLAFTPLLESIGVLFMFATITVFSFAAMFESPAGRALLPHIVKEEEILTANSLINIAATTAGILLAILIFVILGQGDNFQLILGLSTGFLAGAFLFSLFLRDPKHKAEPGGKATHSYLADLMAGMKFLRGNVLLFFLIASVTLVFIGQIAYVNRPAFIEYHAGAQGYILFVFITMLGGLIASFIVQPLGKKCRVGPLLLMFSVLAGGLRILFVLVIPESFFAALGITVIIATILNAAGIVEGTLEQKIPPKDMVGRVDTMSTTFFAISVALGALTGGFIGRVVPDIAYIFITQGVIVLLSGVYYILVPAIRKLPKFSDIAREGEDSDEATASQSQ